MSEQNGKPCKNPDNRALFFSDFMDEQVKAAAMCLDCPFMVECMALGESEAYGVWGGKTEWERPKAQVAEAKRLKDAARIEREQAREFEAKVIDLLIVDGNTQREAATILGVPMADITRAKDAYNRRNARSAAKTAA